MTNFIDIDARNAAVKRARGLGIWVEGYADLDRALKTIDEGIRKEMRRELRQVARPILTQARSLAPRKSGDLQRSLRTSVTARGIAFTSSEPYSNLIHWGGSTGRGHRARAPWSGDIRVRESLFFSRALEENEDALMDGLDAAVDRAATRAGFQ